MKNSAESYTIYPTLLNSTHFCLTNNVTYDHRVYDEEHFRYCSVPDTGYDAILFAAVGILLTCIAPRKNYALLMLLAGVAVGILTLWRDTREFGNSVNLWISLSPAETFFYVFLPPLLLDSAVRIDFFVFKKVIIQILVFAFLVVAANTVALAAFMMFGMGLKSTWTWTDAFLFATMIASTDAVAVTAIMKEGGSPEELGTLIEGESLLNDATSIVFFNLFWPRFKASITGVEDTEPVLDVIGGMAFNIFWLATGGLFVGIACGVLTSWILKYLQSRRGHAPVVEVGVITGISYLCFYVANAPMKVSGVIAVVVYGLYGSANTLWDMSPRARESKIFENFWDVMSLLTNGVVFFYAGALATVFFWRLAVELYEESHFRVMWMVFGWLPIIYIVIFAFRFLEIAMFSPLLKLMGAELKWSETTFISLAGLRGALALILAQTLLQYEIPSHMETKIQVRAQSALWTCGFTMLTLLINAPAIPWLLRITGLDKVSKLQQESRVKAQQAFLHFTKTLISQLKKDKDEMLRGVDWKVLESFAGISEDSSSGDSCQDLGSESSQGNDSIEGGVKDAQWNLLNSLREPLLNESVTDQSMDIEKGSSAEERVRELDRTLEEVGEGGNDAPFSGSLKSREALFDATKSIRGVLKVRVKVPDEKKKSHVAFESKLVARKSSGTVVASTNLNKIPMPPKNTSQNPGKGVGSQTVIIERTQSTLLEDIEPSLHGASFTSQTSIGQFLNQDMQGSFTTLRRRDPKLPESWHNNAADETSGLLSRQMSAEPTKLNQEVAFLPQRSQSVTALSDDAWASLVNGMRPLDEDESSDTEVFGDDMNDVDEAMQEARIRLVSGMKKYFHEKHTAGLLSGKGLRILSHRCNACMEQASLPLDLWKSVKKEISEGFYLKCLARISFTIRRAIMAVRLWPRVTRAPTLLFLLPVSNQLGSILTRAMRLALEVAIEFWLALLTCRNHALLLNQRRSISLADEVRMQAELVWQFIIDREIEAPDRFQAIQTFRATKAILQQQKAYVEQLHACGLLDESQNESLLHDIMDKFYLLQKHSMNWKPRGLFEFVSTIPIFAHASKALLMKIIASSQLRSFQDGQVIIQAGRKATSDKNGIHIVISGMLRREIKDRNGVEHDFYLGRGGVLGLLPALTGTHMPNMRHAFAELNALGHGPSILTIPRTTVQRIHMMASNGDEEHQRVELDMFRLAALHVVEYMQDDVMALAIGLFLDMESSSTATMSPSQAEGSSPSEIREDINVHGQHRPGPEPHNNKHRILAAADSEMYLGNITSAWEVSSPASFKDSKAKADQILERMKHGLMEGSLTLLAPSQPFLQGSSFVLMHGSLRSTQNSASAKKSVPPNNTGDEKLKVREIVEFQAPCVFPWIVNSCRMVEAQRFTAGEKGALLVATPIGKEVVKTVIDENGAKIAIPVPSTPPLEYDNDLVQSLPSSMDNFFNTMSKF